MIAAFLEIHHNVQQRHLVTAAGIKCLKVTCQDVLVVLPMKKKINVSQLQQGLKIFIFT